MKRRKEQVLTKESGTGPETSCETLPSPDAESQSVSSEENMNPMRRPRFLHRIRAKVSAETAEADRRKHLESTFTAPRFSRPFRPKRHEKIRKVLDGNDIKYRGPLSYRHLRILAWLMCAIAAGGSILLIAYRFIPNLLPAVNDFGQLFSNFSNLALPLFMLANFTVILNAKNGYRQLLITYAASALLLIFCFIFSLEHYAFGIFEVLLGNRAEGTDAVLQILSIVSPYGCLSFNIFIDLFLCTLLTFFLSYQPRRLFKGKWHILFRCLAILPIAYEIASVVLKLLAGLGEIVLPYYVWPFLTTKPPILFFIFLAIAVFIKKRERRFRKSGFTHTEYMRYLKTNRNSLQFSLRVFLIFIIGAVIDVLTFIILPIIFALTLKGIESEDQLEPLFQVIINVGVGKGLYMLIMSPVTLLFSYTRLYKNRTVDRLIPVGGILFVILFSIELVYQMIRMMPNL